MIKIDHIGIAAKDARASATALAEILGVVAPVTDGADDDMFRIDLDHGASLLFSTVAPDAPVAPEHIAFRVEESRFAEVVGGAGRVYFVDANGHLFEVTC